VIFSKLPLEVKDWFGSVVVSSVYYPPKHIVVSEQFEAFLETLDACFTAVGDYIPNINIGDPD